MTRSQRALVAILVVGVVVMVVGTFGPWLQSGRVTRNVYRTAGLLRRLLALPSGATTALELLPLLATLCALGLLGIAFGWRRPAAGLLGLIALVLGALAAGVLLAPRSSEVQAARLGPVITLVGCLLTIAPALVLVASKSADRR